MKPAINVVWFKKDLRLSDHAPLHAAINATLPTLLLFFFEPLMIAQPAINERQGWFLYYAAIDMQLKLNNVNATLYICHKEVNSTFEYLSTIFYIQNIFAYQETNIGVTYIRDKSFRKWCKNENINLQEFENNGIFRGLKNMHNWNKYHLKFIKQPEHIINLKQLVPLKLTDQQYKQIKGEPIPKNFIKPDKPFNKNLPPLSGGETNAFKTLNLLLKSFQNINITQSLKTLDKPFLWNNLAPYLSFGNISYKQAYKLINTKTSLQNNPKILKLLNQLLLKNAQQIQFFEINSNMEFENLNIGLNGIRVSWNNYYYEAWCNAITGVPLVDASMRCLKNTGYLDNRLKALLISFLTHYLWLDWRKGAAYLAKFLIDYEAGLHFYLFQEVAGTLGIPPPNIINPTILAKKLDPNGLFVQQWLPELRCLPTPLCHTPWKLTNMEVVLYKYKIGKNYPNPIINLETSFQKAQKELHRVFNLPITIAEKQKLQQLFTHL